MSDTNKCPHCGASEWKYIPDSLAQACKCGYVRVSKSGGGWEAGATIQEWTNDLCSASARIKAKTELAATKRELEECKRVSEQRLDAALELGGQLDGARRDLDEVRTSLDLHKSELRIANARILTSEARVAELEGLKLGFTRPSLSAGTWVDVFLPIQSVSGTTLGQAMPAKEWGPYKLQSDGFYRLQAMPGGGK